MTRVIIFYHCPYGIFHFERNLGGEIERRQTIRGREQAWLPLVERPQLFTPSSSIHPGLPVVRAFRSACFKMLSALRTIGRSRASSNPHCVVLHDPGAERPHDLDDPFFEKEV